MSVALPDHLVPVNAALAMLDAQEHDYPTPLADTGFELVGVEVPLYTDEGEVVVDVAAATTDRSVFLLIECKSGRNINTGQIKSYRAAEWEEVVRATGVDLPEPPAEQHVAVAFVVTEEHAVDFAEHLDGALHEELPVISVGDEEIAVVGDGDLAAAFLNDVEWPLSVDLPCPRRMPFDHQCDWKVAFDAVAAEMIGHLTRAREYEPEAYTFDPEDVLRAVAPAYDHLVHQAARSGTKRIVDEAVRAVVHVAPSVFDYSHGDDGPTIAVLSTPEAHKLQGRTQSYQAILKDLEQDAVELTEASRPRTLFEEAEAGQ